MRIICEASVLLMWRLKRAVLIWFFSRMMPTCNKPSNEDEKQSTTNFQSVLPDFSSKVIDSAKFRESWYARVQEQVRWLRIWALRHQAITIKMENLCLSQWNWRRAVENEASANIEALMMANGRYAETSIWVLSFETWKYKEMLFCH
jgi:hypothetical protein